MAKVAVKTSDSVIYTDTDGVESVGIVSIDHGDDIVSLHVLRAGKSGAIWTPDVPHANKVKGKKGVASWKQAP